MTVVAMTYISEMFPARSRGAYQARDPDDRPLRHSRDGVRRPLHHPDGVVGLARGVRLGIARDLLSAVRGAASRNRRAGSSIGPARRSRRGDGRASRRASGRSPASCRRAGGLDAPSAPGRAAFREIVASGSLGRLVLLISHLDASRRSASTVSCRGCRRCSSSTASRSCSSLEQSSAISIGAVPGAWIARDDVGSLGAQVR